MSQPLENYQPITTTDTHGLDDLFDQGVLKDSLIGRQGVLVNREGVLPEVAALQLGLSVSGVLKRLRKGDLPGFKVPAQRGEKWMVCATALPEGVLGLAKESSIRSEESSMCSEESFAIECAQVAVEQSANIDVAELLRKLEGATYRIGYLESKLEERQKEVELHQQQIKLLTDSQHKPGWWAKFSSWFFKGQ
jgi:hypothetical protein